MQPRSKTGFGVPGNQTKRFAAKTAAALYATGSGMAAGAMGRFDRDAPPRGALYRIPIGGAQKNKF